MDFTAARAGLVQSLAREIKDKRVLEALARVPRERFVPPEYQQIAYEDRPLPIGLNQTISQPYIVAVMTQGLELTGDERVLEVGTGSGYQAAILAELCRQVVTTERLPELLEAARKVLTELGYDNVEMHLAEEGLGWKPGAPYDGIIATAAAPTVPDELLEQLKLGGRLVIPVGSRYLQELYRITRREGENVIDSLGACRFVSLIGRGAWPEEEDLL